MTGIGSAGVLPRVCPQALPTPRGAGLKELLDSGNDLLHVWVSSPCVSCHGPASARARSAPLRTNPWCMCCRWCAEESTLLLTGWYVLPIPITLSAVVKPRGGHGPRVGTCWEPMVPGPGETVGSSALSVKGVGKPRVKP